MVAIAALPVRGRRFCLAALLLVQGCSGGGGSATPNPLPRPSASATASALPSAKSALTLRVFIPAKKATAGKRRAFVSSSTNGLMISVYTSPEAANPTPLATGAVDLSASSSACAASATGRTCTITFPIPPGTVDIVFASYDEAPVSGAFPSGAHELATATLVGLKIVSGTANSFSVALGGVVSSIVLTPAFRSLDAAVSGSYTLGVTAFDADGNMIVAGSETATNGSSTETDTYANPIALSVSAGGSDISLSLNGATPAASVTVTKSSDIVTVNYDGAAASGYSATIGATAAGATSATATFAPLFALPRTVAFSGANQSQNVTISESGFAGTFTAAVTNGGTTACPSGAVTLGTLASGSPATLVVTSGSSAATGCTIAIGDPTTTVDVTASVTLSGTTVVVPSRPILAAYGDTVETIDLDNTAQTSTLTVGVPGAPNGDRLSVSGVARDAAGNVYAAASATSGSPAQQVIDNAALEEFAAGSAGTATPLAAISLPLACQARNIAVDRQNNVYVACQLTGSVLEFAAGLTSTTPIATITGVGNTAAIGVAVDAAGNVYVDASTGDGAIYVYAPPAAGTDTAPPMRSITGSSTGIDGGRSDAVDAAGNVYAVTGYSDDPALEFGPQASGNVAPAATFPINGFGSAVAVDAGGTKLYVSYLDTSTSTSAINVYSVANPSATPQTIPLPATPVQLAL